MNKIKVRKIKKAESKIARLSACISKELSVITENIQFEGFDKFGLEPSVEVCSGAEVIILCKGYELHIDKALETLERNGCIRPEDIPGVKNNLIDYENTTFAT